MKTTIITALAVMALAAPVQAESLRDLINRVDQEDQRVKDGSYNRNTQVLTLYTEDMVAGKDGDISRRAVNIDMSGVQGRDGTNGTDAVVDYGAILSGQSVSSAIGTQELMEPVDGGWSYGIGIAGMFTDYGNDQAVSGGIAYGLSEGSMTYMKVSTDFDGSSVAVAAGYSAQF